MYRSPGTPRWLGTAMAAGRDEYCAILDAGLLQIDDASRVSGWDSRNDLQLEDYRRPRWFHEIGIDCTLMVTQVRVYTINSGMVDSWIKVFNEKIVPTSASYGVHVIGAWVNRPQNEFVWVRTFEDEETLKRYETSPERAEYTPITSPHIAKIEVRTVENALLVPAAT
jgi:quinol monooxygenase YgiN